MNAPHVSLSIVLLAGVWGGWGPKRWSIQILFFRRNLQKMERMNRRLWAVLLLLLLLVAGAQAFKSVKTQKAPLDAEPQRRAAHRQEAPTPERKSYGNVYGPEERYGTQRDEL